MCASLCTADEMCNAYHFNKTSSCILGNATQLVGANARSKETTQVHINAALVPGMSFAFATTQAFCKNLMQLMQVGFQHSTTQYLLIPSVNGSLGQWIDSGDGDGIAFIYEICGNASKGRVRELKAPKNGGFPSQQWIEDNIPRQHLYGAPYRCNCEF